MAFCISSASFIPLHAMARGGRDESIAIAGLVSPGLVKAQIGVVFGLPHYRMSIGKQQLQAGILNE